MCLTCIRTCARRLRLCSACDTDGDVAEIAISLAQLSRVEASKHAGTMPRLLNPWPGHQCTPPQRTTTPPSGPLSSLTAFINRVHTTAILDLQPRTQVCLFEWPCASPPDPHHHRSRLHASRLSASRPYNRTLSEPTPCAVPQPGARPGAPPRPWTAHMSPSGQPYYYNHVTRESSWVWPSPSQPRPPPQPVPYSGGPGPGRPGQYTHSANTDQPSWTQPPNAVNPGPSAATAHVQGPPHVSRPPPAASQPSGPPAQRPHQPPPLAAPPLARPPPAVQHPRMPGPPMGAQPRMHGGPGVHHMHAGMWRPWMGPPRPPGGLSQIEQEAAAAEAAKAAQRKFRQMLVEHEVNEFSRWEKACKKFDADPRNAAQPPHINLQAHVQGASASPALACCFLAT